MTRPRTTGGATGSAGPVAEITGLEVVVVTERDSSGELLLRELQRTRNRVRHVWPPPDPLPSELDVLFCDALPGLPARLPWLPGEPKAALVLMFAAGSASGLDLIGSCAPEALLHRPFQPAAIVASLFLARSRFDYETRLRGRIDRMDATLRATRSVERAKSILMQTRRLDESAAYHYLRSQAMERRLPVGAVASAIVDAHDIIG